jgi:hypothetical protein
LDGGRNGSGAWRRRWILRRHSEGILQDRGYTWGSCLWSGLGQGKGLNLSNIESDFGPIGMAFRVSQLNGPG